MPILHDEHNPLSLSDGRIGWIGQMIYNARLYVSHPLDLIFVENEWCYASWEDAELALQNWDPLIDDEPTGWIKHPTTGRYRQDGDATKEIRQR